MSRIRQLLCILPATAAFMQDFLDMPGAADRTEYIFLNGSPLSSQKMGAAWQSTSFK